MRGEDDRQVGYLELRVEDDLESGRYEGYVLDEWVCAPVDSRKTGE
jgi:hypothetical protein